MPVTRPDAINNAPDHFGSFGFTMENALSNHDPTVAESITTLGCSDEVADWAEVLNERRSQDIVADWVPIFVPGHFG